MQNKKDAQKAKAGAYQQEDLTPLINRLDAICERLEIFEVFGELLFIWKDVRGHKAQLNVHTFSTLGKFLHNEAFEMRNEIAAEIMDRLSLIENRKESKQ